MSEQRNNRKPAAPHGSTASPAQRRANRRNAQRSTGPTSAEGKARAAQNARTHGAFCRDMLLPGEEPADLCELIVGVYAALSPQDALERELADRIVSGHWRLRRLRRAERYAYGAAADRRADRDETDFLRQTWWAGRGSRHRASMRRVLGIDAMDAGSAADVEDARAAAEAQRKHEAKSSTFRHDPAERAAGLDVAQALADPAGVLERFSRIAQRLEQSITRATRELRELRQARMDGEMLHLPCPYLDLDDDEEEHTETTVPTPSSPIGVATSVAMSADETNDAKSIQPRREKVAAHDKHDAAQNEPNSSDPDAGHDDHKGYAGASCDVDFAGLMKIATWGAASAVGGRRGDLKTA